MLTATGGIDKLDVTYVPDAPAPHAGEVRVGIRAAALNHLDLFVAEGLPGTADRFPHIVEADGCGIIESVGPDVTTVRAGDRVGRGGGRCRGAAARAATSDRGIPAVLDRAPVVRAPAPIPALAPPLSWGEAAAFSLVTLTAWRMLVTRARVKAGETVLVWGIGGGVSLTALRIAKLCGARVIVTSSSDAKLAAAKALGADVTLNHGTQNVSQEVRALTTKRGVDIVVENVGAATWDESLRCLGRGGRLVTCGATTGPQVGIDLRRLFWHHWSVLGSTMGNAAEYAEIVRRLGNGELRPIVDRVYPLNQVQDAYERLTKAQQLGKIVVEVS